MEAQANDQTTLGFHRLSGKCLETTSEPKLCELILIIISSSKKLIFAHKELLFLILKNAVIGLGASKGGRQNEREDQNPLRKHRQGFICVMCKAARIKSDQNEQDFLKTTVQ